MTQVFVSYKQAERDRIKPLAVALADRGLDVWWDYDIEDGEDFSRRINHQLDRASVVVVVWTFQSVESDFVRSEAERARGLRKLLPVQLDRCNIPVPFNGYQTNDLSMWDGSVDDSGFERLIGAAFGLVNQGDPQFLPASLYQALDNEAHWRSGSTPLVAALRHARAILDWAFHSSPQALENRAGGLSLVTFQKACEARGIDYPSLGFEGVEPFARMCCTDGCWGVSVLETGVRVVAPYRFQNGHRLADLNLHSAEYYATALRQGTDRIWTTNRDQLAAISHAIGQGPPQQDGTRLYERLRDQFRLRYPPGEVKLTLYTLRNANAVEFKPQHGGGPLAGTYITDANFTAARAAESVLSFSLRKLSMDLRAVSEDEVRKLFSQPQLLELRAA